MNAHLPPHQPRVDHDYFTFTAASSGDHFTATTGFTSPALKSWVQALDYDARYRVVARRSPPDVYRPGHRGRVGYYTVNAATGVPRPSRTVFRRSTTASAANMVRLTAARAWPPDARPGGGGVDLRLNANHQLIATSARAATSNRPVCAAGQRTTSIVGQQHERFAAAGEFAHQNSRQFSLCNNRR
jgi:hypothetical protein